MTIPTKIYSVLEEKGSMTLGEIYASIPDEKSYEIKAVLDDHVAKGFLALENGMYRIRFHLLHYTKKTAKVTQAAKKARRYEDIRARAANLSGSTIIATAAPPSFMNSFLKHVVHRGQGNTGTCFSAGTRILMEDLSYMPISRINVGDYVITHRGEKKRVTEVMRRKWQGNTFKMWVYGFDRPIEGTAEHPILTKSGWKQLGEIAADDFVAIPKVTTVAEPAWELTVHKEHRYGSFDGDYYWVHPRKIEKVPQFIGEYVYNLEVEDDHSYIAESIAVHNCVGQAVSEGADINYLQLTGDLPTDADWAKVRFNVRLNPNDPNSTTYYDVYLPKSMAAAFPYWRSRIRCNVTVPSGTYVSCAMPTWRDEGICLNDQWLLSKDGRTAWRDPYPDAHPVTGEKAYDFAKKHKIDGYASISTKAAMMDAISKYGFVIGAIEVYENFTQIDPKTGIFPDPKGDAVGGHALCFVGYDANYLYCLHSWRDELPAKVGGISWSYFSMGGIEFFTALDASENKIIVDPTPTPPVAKFTATPTSGEAPLDVQFADTSTGSVDVRSWNYGDGSTDINAGAQVSHTYTTAGTYVVTLTVRNTGGANTASVAITVTAPPSPTPPAPPSPTPPTPWERFIKWLIDFISGLFHR